MTAPAKPRKSPCASCPFRRDVPSGIWHESEYEKLPMYDGDASEQRSVRVFSCHQNGVDVCSGWLAHRDPLDMLAVRIGLISDALDPSCADYSTDVPLFTSGQEAAEHGTRHIADPTVDARDSIRKIIATRAHTGRPVTFDTTDKPTG